MCRMWVWVCGSVCGMREWDKGGEFEFCVWCVDVGGFCVWVNVIYSKW